MPGLPYPAFRVVNAEPGDGKPSPYSERPCGLGPKTGRKALDIF